MNIEKFKMLFLPILLFTATLLSIAYSILNTDPHHWGFISGTALEYIYGKSLFSEIYIQYGIGQALLFKFFNFLIPVNYTSTGILSAFVYSLNLWVIYQSVKKIAGSSFALMLMAVIFLLHPFSIYPWPDYYAGLSLSLGCFFILKSEKTNSNKYALFAGLMFFVAFVFRSTYLVSFLAASSVYLILSFFVVKIRSRNIFVSIILYFSTILLFLSCLYFQNTFQNWYEQAIGASASQYGISFNSMIRLLTRILFPPRPYLPNMLANTVVSLIFYIAILYLLAGIFLKDVKKCSNTVFFSLLGMAGFLQASLGYEIFRIQNACSPLYLVAAYVVAENRDWISMRLKLFRFRVGMVIFFIFLAAPFPHASTLFPLYDSELKEYSASKIPYFKWHYFRPEENAYYDALFNYICDGKSVIVNLSMDSTIPYLCKDQKNKFGLPFFNAQMTSKIASTETQEVMKGEFKKDEIIIADFPVPRSPNVELLEVGRAIRPKSIRFFGLSEVVVYKVKN